MTDSNIKKVVATPIDAFQSSAVWNAKQIAGFFEHCKDPLRSSREYLRRRKRDGLIDSAVVDTYPTPELEKPLHIHRPGRPAPDFDKLAYVLEKRWSIPSEPTTLYFATKRFSRVYGGSWVGCDQIPEPLKAGHNQLVSSVVLHYFKHRPELMLRSWVSEQKLQLDYRRGRHICPIPDGLIVTESKTVAVEVGGRYSAKKLRRHHERFCNARSESGPWHYALW